LSDESEIKEYDETYQLPGSVTFNPAETATAVDEGIRQLG